MVKRSHSDFADELWLNFETLNVTGEADYPVVIKIGTGKYVRYREILGHPISISGIFHYYPLPVGRRALELCGLFLIGLALTCLSHQRLRRIPRLFRAGRNTSRLTDLCSYFVLNSSS